jgi:repressor LexA
MEFFPRAVTLRNILIIGYILQFVKDISENIRNIFRMYLMLTWEERVEVIKSACGVKNNRQLEEALGLSNGYINDLLKGKNKNPAKITAALVTVLKINPSWFYDETVGIFGENANKKQQIDITVRENLRFLDVFDEHIIEVIKRNGLISNMEERLAQLEGRLDRKDPSNGNPADEHPPKYLDYAAEPVSLYTAEPEPEYGAEAEYDTEAEREAEKQVQITYVEDIAAGPPIAQSEDQTGLVSVPARLVKKGFRYYAASVRGGSMIEAGIRDGDMVLIRHTDTPADRAIQVVRYHGKSTLKRLREVEGKGWELHYEDGSGRVVLLDSGGYEVQGEFVAILPKIVVPEAPKKGRRTHEKPFENR